MSDSLIEQMIVPEQIAPEIARAEGSGFRDDIDAGPAAALQRRARQARHDPPCHLQRVRAEGKAYGLQRFSASNDQGSRRIERRDQRRQLARDPLRSVGARQPFGQREFHQRHAGIGQLALNDSAALTFAKRNSGLATCIQLGGSGGLVRAEQAQHRALQFRKRICALAPREGTGQPATSAPQHRPGHSPRHLDDAIEIDVALGVEDLNAALRQRVGVAALRRDAILSQLIQ